MKKYIHIYKLKLMLVLAMICQLSTFNFVHAQQDAEFTMYMFNQLNFNPAYAGVADNIMGTLYYRKQWVNFPGSPETINLNAVVPFKREHFGIGLNVQNDNIGPTANTRVEGSFAYNIDVKEGKLSFGLSAGFDQYRLTKDITTDTPLDPTFQGNYRISPDFGFGIMYNKAKYYIGLSALHLNGPGRTLNGVVSVNRNERASLARHYYLTAGYNIEVTDKFMLTPSFLSSYSEADIRKNFSTTIALKLEYQQMVWFGTSYRTGDALNFFVGVNLGRISPDAFKENIRIGYAFDWTNSRTYNYNQGSHEIFISYEFVPKVKRMMPKFK
jgi:type IX secretion system PorP/SprF family membrane protein